MKGVTEDGGTAYSTFAGFDIEVAGKTGSAETGDPDKVNGWFVGFAPFDDPEISVTVLIEKCRFRRFYCRNSKRYNGRIFRNECK